MTKYSGTIESSRKDKRLVNSDNVYDKKTGKLQEDINDSISSVAANEQKRENAEEARETAFTAAMTNIEDAINKVTQAASNVDKAVDAASTATNKAESAVSNAETAIGAVKTATANAETATTDAKNATDKANTAATNAESIAKTISDAEANRVAAENKRLDSESARVTAESSRVTAEEGRVEAESKRVSAETAREEAETKRESDVAQAIEDAKVSVRYNTDQYTIEVTSNEEIEEAAAHPTKVGEDYYVYVWDRDKGEYTKTDIYVKGDKGEKGDKGDTGTKGDKGAKGDTGATGATGAKGDDGKSPKIQNGTWWLYDDEKGEYVDSGVSVSADYVLTKEKIEGVFTGDISSHTHSAYAKAADLTTEVARAKAAEAAKADASHTHTKADITDLSLSWDAVTGKPTSYTPSAHTHTKSEITDFPTIPSKTSELTNDSGFLTSHQDISGKADKVHTHTKSDITDMPTIPTKTSELTNDSGFVGADSLPTATADSLGMVKVGNGLSIGSDGTLSLTSTIYDRLTKRGVFILDTDNNLFTADEWDTANNSKAVGVAVITEACAFVVALNNASSSTVNWDYNTSTLVDGCNVSSATAIAINDYDGKKNTDAILARGKYNGYPALVCTKYTFANGKTGYLMSAGEAQYIVYNLTEVNSAIAKAGGAEISGWYWTSTQKDASTAWRLQPTVTNVNTISKDSNGNVRAICPLI
jgi:hypothetical protein